MKNAEIGFLQTETPSGKITNSSDRLNWIILLGVIIVLVLYWTWTGTKSNMEVLILLAVMAYAPKSVGKIAEMKYGTKVITGKKREEGGAEQ